MHGLPSQRVPYPCPPSHTPLVPFPPTLTPYPRRGSPTKVGGRPAIHRVTIILPPCAAFPALTPYPRKPHQPPAPTTELLIKSKAQTSGVAAIKGNVTCPDCKRIIAQYAL